MRRETKLFEASWDILLKGLVGKREESFFTKSLIILDEMGKFQVGSGMASKMEWDYKYTIMNLWVVHVVLRMYSQAIFPEPNGF